MSGTINPITVNDDFIYDAVDFCGNDDAAASVAAPAAEDDDVLVPYCASVSVMSGFLDIVESRFVLRRCV